DGRVTLMTLTPEGLAARVKVLDLMRRQLASALDDMPISDRRQLAQLLGRLVTGLRRTRLTQKARS
ncbi:MAG TPA: hypothetical protein VKA05_09265, partial [Acidimicrobiales bacterium]|nr:hypothetical protein [Acidimicrobiales bacterium]